MVPIPKQRDSGFIPGTGSSAFEIFRQHVVEFAGILAVG
jgi:hypothetical protein